MSLYRDPSTRINNDGILLQGLLLPMLSTIQISNEEVRHIEVVDLSLFKKFNILGSQDLKTWWTFDLTRPLKKAGFVVSFKDGKYKLGFTVADFHSAYEVLLEQFGNRVLDLRA